MLLREEIIGGSPPYCLCNAEFSSGDRFDTSQWIRVKRYPGKLSISELLQTSGMHYMAGYSTA